MAIQTWRALSILAGSSELACNARDWDGPNVERQQLDVTPLCSTGWTSTIAGQASSSFSATIMSDFAASGGTDPDTFAALGAVSPVSVMPAGSAAGSIAYAWPSIEMAYSSTLRRGEVAAGRLSGVANGPVARGLVLADTATARTATANTPGQQVGAVAIGQVLAATLHVLSAAPSTSVIAALQSSTTLGGTYTTRGTFAAATAATSERITIVGPISGNPTFWRIAFTISGASPSFVLAVTAGITTP